MAHAAELSSFDLRYESYRMKNAGLEARLFASIVERGIEEPLEGVDVEGERILLDGFKRYRCALKLKLDIVPYSSLGEDEAGGIIQLIRVSNNKSLGILEQARFIDDLRHLHKMSVADIAATLSRSKAWVSMRLGLIGQMSELIKEKIFRGDFPIYAYMYTLRPFMRMNGAKRHEVEQFVDATSGKKLSVREIEQLANGYFQGPEWFREEIRNGHLALPLERMRESTATGEGLNEFEQGLVKDLTITQKYMLRVMTKSQSPRLESQAFFAQADLLVENLLSRQDAFTRMLKELHDRAGQA